MQAHPTSPRKLERIGRYRIVRPLSKGGMALVYEGRRESLAGVAPRVAIKLILPEHKGSRTFKELFINEARLGASMQHQNLVGIQDFDCEGDTYYLVMEFVEGLTLRRIIGLCQKHRIGIPIGVITEIGRQACDGLHYAHSARDEKGRHLRLVHRDMKPSNLILNPHGVVKVLDFGISKGRLRKERQGSVKGTWGYMAPEQARGDEVWPSADVFGLAVVLYELAALRPMFQNKSKDEIKRLLADDHAARMAATLDSHYGPLVGPLVRALQRDPRARHESAADFGRELSSLLPDPISARDEVLHFFERLERLDKGPAQPPVLTSASIVQPAPYMDTEDNTNQKVGWLLTSVVSMVLVVAVTALVAVVFVFLYRDFVVQPVVTHRPDAVAERETTPSPAVQPEAEVVELPVQVAPEPPKPAPVRVPVIRPRPKPKPRPRPVASADVVPAPVPGPVRSVVVRPKEVQPVAEVGKVKIRSVQPAEVYIAGQFVQYAPVTQELPPGRYAVSIVAMDGRRRSFEVNIQAGVTISRNWDFDRMEWR